MTTATTNEPANATSLWRALHAREVAGGKTPLQASKAIDKAHPTLRREMVAEANAAAAARRRR